MTETAQAPPVEGPKKNPKVATDYVVLRKDESGLWDEIGRVTAGSRDSAIKKAADGTDGVYRATPAKGFRPVKLTTETETRVKLS